MKEMGWTKEEKVEETEERGGRWKEGISRVMSTSNFFLLERLFFGQGVVAGFAPVPGSFGEASDACDALRPVGF